MKELTASQTRILNNLTTRAITFTRKGEYSWTANVRIVDSIEREVFTITFSQFDRGGLIATTDQDIDANLDKLDLEKELDKTLNDIHFALDSLPRKR